jgi:hypothetical protein
VGLIVVLPCPNRAWAGGDVVSELPRRPDLDQLRRQARELLRAATAGDQRALARLRVYSERVTLSAAQLAVARERGFSSWAGLKAETESRRAVAAEPSAAGACWSLGGAGAIMTVAGELSPSVLRAGPDQAVLEASLVPSAGTLTDRGQVPVFADVIVTDDRGMRYSIETAAMAGPSGVPGVTRAVSLSLRLQPVPARGCRWLDLRSHDGPVCRLLPSARTAVRFGPVAPAAGTAAERELRRLALSVIQLEFDGADAAARSRRCSTVRAMVAEMRQSGGLDPASELPGLVAELCDVLTGSSSPARLPAGWSAMLDAAQRADGPRYSLDIPADLPPIDGTAVQLGTLVSEPGSWLVYFLARPGWWTYSQDRGRKWAALSVQAEDDRGGMYLHSFGGSNGRLGYEELALRFQPRLDPLARALTLTFTGASQQDAVELELKPATTIAAG